MNEIRQGLSADQLTGQRQTYFTTFLVNSDGTKAPEFEAASLEKLSQRTLYTSSPGSEVFKLSICSNVSALGNTLSSESPSERHATRQYLAMNQHQPHLFQSNDCASSSTISSLRLGRELESMRVFWS